MGKEIRSMICGRVHSNVTYSSFGLLKNVTTFLVLMSFSKEKLAYPMLSLSAMRDLRDEKRKTRRTRRIGSLLQFICRSD